MTSQRAILTLAVSLAALAAAAAGAQPPSAAAPADAAPAVRLYDTGQPGTAPLTAEELSRRTGWKEVVEGDLQHTFAGDAVFLNDQLAVVLRSGANGARVYSRSTGKLRAELAPNHPSSRPGALLSAVKTIENSASAVAVEANYGSAGTMRSRLAAGTFFLEARRPTGGPVWLSNYGKYVVVPDFFGDDLVYDAAAAPSGRVLPAENSLLAMTDDGQSIVACVWAPTSGKERVVVSLDGAASQSASRLDFPKDKGIWIAVFEGKDIWRDCPIEANEAGRAVALDWKPPFSAKWRASLATPDASARSWDLRDVAEVGPPSAAGDECACWFDAGRAMVRMAGPASAGTAPGPTSGSSLRRTLVLYPIDRTGATPLTTYCLTDLMRDALGVGPCQYVLDAEGLGAPEAATPDPVARWVERELSKRPARREGEAIAQRLAAMVAHVRRAQERIDQYRRFAQAAREACQGALDADKTGQIRAAMAILEDMASPGRSSRPPSPAPASGPATAPSSIPARIEALAGAIAKLAEDEGALEKSRDALAGIRAAGARQDYELARLRMGVRRLIALWPPAATREDGDSPAGKVRLGIERMIETMGLAPASRPAGR